MGNREWVDAIKFRQSMSDFPLTVNLGDKKPIWGLSRWAGNDGLRFIPPDDEGFTLRGDKRRLVYKGRRRSHRFTILEDGAFEYDCILNKEPESNIVSLRMEGAENYDFFRQPDFVPDPFLKGSYAVYKKETLIGEGTGKLCHIHRPEIIDARGRRCWGDLLVVGNCLNITIPENWLSEAVYPVIVDPVVGTNTIGTQLTTPIFSSYYVFCKYPVSEKIAGLCTAHIYCCDEWSLGTLTPVLFSDNNNRPHLKKSKNEGYISCGVDYKTPLGWRSTNFTINGTLGKGSIIWFGVETRSFRTMYDYAEGGTAALYDPYFPSEILPGANVEYYDRRYSWYFMFESGPPGDDFFCILTGNVSLTDNRKCKADYKRNTAETVQGTGLIKSSFLFQRMLSELAGIIDKADRWKENFRLLLDNVGSMAETARAGEFYRTERDSVKTAGTVFRSLLLFTRILTQVFAGDYLLRRFLKAREEIILKSCITREITLESKVN